jgi:uncharacterized protein
MRSRWASGTPARWLPPGHRHRWGTDSNIMIDRRIGTAAPANQHADHPIGAAQQSARPSNQRRHASGLGQGGRADQGCLGADHLARIGNAARGCGPDAITRIAADLSRYAWAYGRRLVQAFFMRIGIWVRPGSAHPGVGGQHAGALVVRVSARPTDGKATVAALAAVAAALGIPRSAVKLVAGAAGRAKVVDVTGADPAVVARLMASTSRSG